MKGLKSSCCAVLCLTVVLLRESGTVQVLFLHLCSSDTTQTPVSDARAVLKEKLHHLHQHKQARES